jgi:hypothetical protein
MPPVSRTGAWAPTTSCGPSRGRSRSWGSRSRPRSRARPRPAAFPPSARGTPRRSTRRRSTVARPRQRARRQRAPRQRAARQCPRAAAGARALLLPTRPPTSPTDPAALDAAGIGAVLYAALTARWPLEAATALPAAPYVDGHLCSPRQVRAGVPADLDDIACRALAGMPRRGGAPLRSPAGGGRRARRERERQRRVHLGAARSSASTTPRTVTLPAGSRPRPSRAGRRVRSGRSRPSSSPRVWHSPGGSCSSPSSSATTRPYAGTGVRPRRRPRLRPRADGHGPAPGRGAGLRPTTGQRRGVPGPGGPGRRR